MPSERSYLRTNQHVAILLVVGGEECQLVRRRASTLRNDEAMLVIVQVWPARFDSHFKIILLAASSIFELTLVSLVVRRRAVNAAHELRSELLHLLVSLGLARAFDVDLEVWLSMTGSWSNTATIGLKSAHI